MKMNVVFVLYNCMNILGCGESGNPVSNEEGAEMKGLQQDIALIQSRYG